MPQDFNNNNNSNNQTNENKPIIEIPQKFYDKLDKERQEAKAAAIKKENETRQMHENISKNSSIFGLALLNAIIIPICLYGMLKVDKKIIFAIPIYIFIISIIGAFKHRKNSNVPTSILIGNIICAVISFVISIVKEAEMELWTYYAIFFAAIAFLGLITSNILTYFVYNKKNIKALESLGILLYFIALIGIPIYLEKKFPEEFHKIVFHEKTIIVASTEEEYVTKTLNNRYNTEFTCQKGRRTNNIFGYSSTNFTCKDASNRETKVISTIYNSSDVLYIVQDNYADILFIKNFKEMIENNLKSVTGSNITLYLYPKSGCSFIGDCHDCEEYTAVYQSENDLDNLYEFSKNLSLTPYLNLNAIDFVNQYEFKYIIEVSGNYTSMTDNTSTISNILSSLNSSKLKNTYGYDIILKNSNEFNRIVYKVTGKTNNNQEFNNPIVVE